MELLFVATRGVDGNNGRYYDPYWEFFGRAAGYSGVKDLQIAYARIDDLFIAVGDGSFVIRDMANGKDLSEYGAVLIRGHLDRCVDGVKAVSLYLRQWNIPVVNDYATIHTGSKLIQAVNFHMHELPVASTVLVTQVVAANPADLPFGFPCIMKATNGSRGNFNYKIDGPEDVGRVLAQDGSMRNFVLQRFVPNDGDYRILVAGNGFLIMKRSAVDGSHLNNVSQGASAELVDPGTLPVEVVEQARRIVREVGMAVAGVDVLYDEGTGSCSFLEVNPQPEFVNNVFPSAKAELVGGFLGELAGRPV